MSLEMQHIPTPILEEGEVEVSSEIENHLLSNLRESIDYFITIANLHDSVNSLRDINYVDTSQDSLLDVSMGGRVMEDPRSTKSLLKKHPSFIPAFEVVANAHGIDDINLITYEFLQQVIAEDREKLIAEREKRGEKTLTMEEFNERVNNARVTLEEFFNPK